LNPDLLRPFGSSSSLLRGRNANHYTIMDFIGFGLEYLILILIYEGTVGASRSVDPIRAKKILQA
jgi:hypothetical protein